MSSVVERGNSTAFSTVTTELIQAVEVDQHPATHIVAMHIPVPTRLSSHRENEGGSDRVIFVDVGMP
jgi:hypothetical protein